LSPQQPVADRHYQQDLLGTVDGLEASEKDGKPKLEVPGSNFQSQPVQLDPSNDPEQVRFAASNHQEVVEGDSSQLGVTASSAQTPPLSRQPLVIGATRAEGDETYTEPAENYGTPPPSPRPQPLELRPDDEQQLSAPPSPGEPRPYSQGGSLARWLVFRTRLREERKVEAQRLSWDKQTNNPPGTQSGDSRRQPRRPFLNRSKTGLRGGNATHGLVRAGDLKHVGRDPFSDEDEDNDPYGPDGDPDVPDWADEDADETSHRAAAHSATRDFAARSGLGTPGRAPSNRCITVELEVTEDFMKKNSPRVQPVVDLSNNGYTTFARENAPSPLPASTQPAQPPISPLPPLRSPGPTAPASGSGIDVARTVE
jgi:hypothetical protein